MEKSYLKEGICGQGGEGSKKEGKVPEGGHSMSEAMRMETAGQQGAEGKGKHNLKSGNHNKGGGKINLGSDRPHPKDKPKFRRT